MRKVPCTAAPFYGFAKQKTTTEADRKAPTKDQSQKAIYGWAVGQCLFSKLSYFL